MDPQLCTRPADSVVAELAARQWGVVARSQLLDAGLSPTAVRARMRGGHLLPLYRGVYAVGHRQLRREGNWLAAVLALGPGAVLSHRDAAGLHDLRPANHLRIDVTTPNRGRGRGSDRGIQVHLSTGLDARDITTVHGIPTTTVARTLLDLAGTVPRDHLAKAIKEAERRNVLDVEEIEAAMARTRGRRGPGHRALRAAIAEHEALGLSASDSALEDAVHRLVRRASLPSPAINAYVEGFRVDAMWRDQRVIVELDGWAWHHTRDAFERDRERDAALTAQGWRVVRFTHRQVIQRPDAVIETLRRLGIR